MEIGQLDLVSIKKNLADYSRYFSFLLNIPLIHNFLFFNIVYFLVIFFIIFLIIFIAISGALIDGACVLILWYYNVTQSIMSTSKETTNKDIIKNQNDSTTNNYRSTTSEEKEKLIGGGVIDAVADTAADDDSSVGGASLLSVVLHLGADILRLCGQLVVGLLSNQTPKNSVLIDATVSLCISCLMYIMCIYLLWRIVMMFWRV